MTPTVLAAEGNAAVTMSTEIKTAITTACQSAVDVCKDGIVAVLPIGLSLMIITHIKKTYVIFICLKDVFGKNLPIYTFNNICEQNHSLTLGDEATKVIVNAEGSRDDLSENMRSFLDYLIEKKATKEQTEAITQPANKKSRLK